MRGDIVADLKTPPCNLGTAKFSSIRVEEVLALGVLGFCKNGLDFGVREVPITGNVLSFRGSLWRGDPVDGGSAFAANNAGVTHHAQKLVWVVFEDRRCTACV